MVPKKFVCPRHFFGQNTELYFLTAISTFSGLGGGCWGKRFTYKKEDEHFRGHCGGIVVVLLCLTCLWFVIFNLSDPFLNWGQRVIKNLEPWDGNSSSGSLEHEM